MLLALRSLYEPEITVIPPAGRVFRGSPPLGRPLFIVDAEVILPSAKFRARAGNIVATGTAEITLQSARGRFNLAIPRMSGDGTAKITGARIRIRNAHEVRHSSLTLGQNRVTPCDDDEAMALILGNL